MASTYTVNLGIEKIGTGEQAGTWGDTTNTNFDIIDQAVNGIVSITLASAGTSGSPNTLPISDGSLSNGRNAFIEFTDLSDLGATAYVQLTPNNAEKVVVVRNSLSGSQTLILFQGVYNASNDIEVPNGTEMVVKFDGGGTNATVTQVYEKINVGGVLVAGAIDATSSGVALTTASLQGSLKEEVAELTITAGSGDIDPANGGVQYATLTEDTTLTESLASGDAVFLRVSGADTYTLTLPTLSWATGSGNVAPIFQGIDFVLFWKEGSTLYAAYAGYTS